MGNQAPPGFYTEEEVGNFLNKKVDTLRQDASRRKGPPRVRVGRRVFYRIDAFNNWLVNHEADFDTLRVAAGM